MMVHRGIKSMLVALSLLNLLSQSSGKPMSQLTFEKHPEFLETSVGESVVLSCKAEGSPSPVLYWERDGKRLSQEIHEKTDLDYELPSSYENNNEDVLEGGPKGSQKGTGSRLMMSSTMSRLYLDCITPEEAGEYTCVASTPNQRLRTSTTVELDSTKSRHSCLDQKQGKNSLSPAVPRIYMWTVSRLEYEGSTVQLFCRVDGQPEPEVTWIDPRDNIIKDSEQYQLLKNGDLLISDVKWSRNMGFYRCVAKNNNGATDEVTTFLYPIAS